LTPTVRDQGRAAARGEDDMDVRADVGRSHSGFWHPCRGAGFWLGLASRGLRPPGYSDITPTGVQSPWRACRGAAAIRSKPPRVGVEAHPSREGRRRPEGRPPAGDGIVTEDPPARTTNATLMPMRAFHHASSKPAAPPCPAPMIGAATQSPRSGRATRRGPPRHSMLHLAQMKVHLVCLMLRLFQILLHLFYSMLHLV
jgi:hypothetical protein